MINTLRVFKFYLSIGKSYFNIYFILFLTLLGFAFIGSYPFTLYITCSYVVTSVSAEIFSFESKNNLIYIRRKSAIMGKYIFFVFNFLIFSLLAFVLHFASISLKNLQLNVSQNFVSFIFCFLIFSLLFGIQTPVYVKCGFNKGKILALIVYGLVFIIVLIILKIQFQNVVNYNSLFNGPFPTYCLFIGVSILYCSYKISLCVHS